MKKLKLNNYYYTHRLSFPTRATLWTFTVRRRMDPWSSPLKSTDLEKVEKTEDKESGDLKIGNNFHDNFQPFTKLPDSPEYLASLEKKLAKVERGCKRGHGISSKEILESLKLSHQSCMVNLLTDSISNFSDSCGGANEDIKVNPILKIIAPEKQAIGVEELVHLVKADQLELLLVDTADETGEDADTQLKEGSQEQ